MAFVQSTYGNTAAVTHPTIIASEYWKSNSPNNCIVVDLLYILAPGSTGTMAVTDSAGNIYKKVFSNPFTGIHGGVPVPVMEIWIAIPIVRYNVGGAGVTVTATYIQGTGSAYINVGCIAIHEYSNIISVTPIDGYDSGWSDTGPNASATAVITTTNAIDILHGFSATNTDTPSYIVLPSSRPNNGWTLRQISVDNETAGACILQSYDIPVNQTLTAAFSDDILIGGAVGAAMVALISNIIPPPPPGSTNNWLIINESVIGYKDRTSYLDMSDEGGSRHSFTSTLRQRGTAQVPIRIAAGDSYYPTIGTQAYLYDQVVSGYELVFAGNIRQIDIDWIDDAGNIELQLTVISFESCFDVLLIPPQTFNYQSAGDIFAALLANVCGGVPVQPGIICTPSIYEPSVAITSATNANPVVFTAASVPPNLETVIQGLTGNWASIIGNYPTTKIDSTHFSINVDSTTFGTLTGMPIWTPPFVEVQVEVAWDKVSDIFNKLATDSSCVWGIDLTTTPASVYIKPANTTSAPFILESSDVLFGSMKWNQNLNDFRNRQVLNISQSAFGDSSELFPFTGLPGGAGLLRPVKTVTFAWLTALTQNSAIGTFTAQPSPGDQVSIGYPGSGSIYNWAPDAPYSQNQVIVDPSNFIQQCSEGNTSSPANKFSGNTEPSWNDTIGGNTIDGAIVWTCLGPSGPGGIGGAIYTFVTQANLNNTQWGQVVIGATFAQTCQNLIDAINNNAQVQGQTFSCPTWENPLVNASLNSSGVLKIVNKAAGLKYIASLSATGTAFSWSGAQTSGASTGSNSTYPLSIAENGSSNTANLYYTPGSLFVSMASFPSGLSSFSGYLQVQYQRQDGTFIVCENTASVNLRAQIENGTGKYQALTNDSNQTSNSEGLSECQSALTAFSQIPISFSFSTYRNGIQPGQLLTISLVNPQGVQALLNVDGSVYVVQEITAEFLPNKTSENQIGHYKYTITVINISQIFSYLEFWQQLASSSGGASSDIGPSGAIPGPATVTGSVGTGYTPH